MAPSKVLQYLWLINREPSRGGLATHTTVAGLIVTGTMVKKLINPIQQVLEAERAAEAEIAAARAAAEAAVTEARRQAPVVLHRNEARTQRAVKRYEEQQSKLLKKKTHALRQVSAANLADEQALLDQQFSRVVDEIFNDVWPSDDQS